MMYREDSRKWFIAIETIWSRSIGKRYSCFVRLILFSLFVPIFICRHYFNLVCCILTIQLTVGEYKLVDSHGKEATYRSDYQTSPIIGPLPREMSYGNTTLKLHECGISFHPNHAMMKDIIKIYNDVTFGKGYLERCSGNSNEASKHTSEGRSLINVKVNFNKNNDQYLSKGKIFLHKWLDKQKIDSTKSLFFIISEL